MATAGIIRGMGSAFMDCEHPDQVPHEYKIRYRNAAGKQAQEGGFSTRTGPSPGSPRCTG
ncbi:hypothetical protein [Kitasatospora sp. KL5]|uniref:hypothetical protein n=1 Tax=Kitasatospora sp. KL5 TaxID=3425125 RepID=UPI003D6EA701